VTRSERTGVAVVGLGAIGMEHAAIYRAAGDVELVGNHDLDADRAARVAAEFGGTAYPSVADIAADARVDAVSLCTPDHLHVADAMTLLEAAKHVLIEKPVALTSDDVMRLAGTAASSGVVAMPGHTLRFDPRYNRLAREVRGGVLGEVVHGYLRRDNLQSVARRAVGRVSVAWFLGTHDVDALMWISGLDVVEVQAMATSSTEPGGRQAWAILATLRLSNGGVVHLESSWGLPDSYPTGLDAAFRLVGSVGEVNLVNYDSGIRIISSAGVSLPPQGGMVHGRPQGALQTELSHFIDCARTGSRPVVTMEEAARVAAVITAIDEAVNTGTTVEVAEVEVP